MVLMGKCDDLLVMHRTAELCLFVDDLTIHVTGTENHVADELTATVDDCIFMLEDELGLRVSRGRHGEFDDKAKSVAVASTPTLEAKLQPRLKRHGIQTKCKVKFLGIDYCGGRVFRRDVQRHRMDTVASRAHRMRQCGRKAARHLLRTGVAPAVRYGCVVVGAPNGLVQRARRFACSVEGNMRGRSAFGRTQLSGYDLGGQMALDPLLAWSRAVWDAFVPTQQLHLAWRYAVRTVALAAQPFSKVSGPVGAAVASAQRLGWKLVQHHDGGFVMMQDGQIADMQAICPFDFGKLAVERLCRMDAEASQLGRRIGGPPDMEPLRNMLRSKGLSPAAAGSLRALGEGAWWTQARLFDAGVKGVDDDICRACGPEVDDGPPCRGDHHHRCCTCPALRRERADKEIMTKALHPDTREQALFQHGLPILPPTRTIPKRVGKYIEGDGSGKVVVWCGQETPTDVF